MNVAKEQFERKEREEPFMIVQREIDCWWVVLVYMSGMCLFPSMKSVIE